MSYILDALRRAEAQRARGAVPTLHAPSLGVGGRLADAPPHPRRVGLALVVAVVLLLTAVALGVWLARPGSPMPVTSASPGASPSPLATTGPGASSPSLADRPSLMPAPWPPLPTPAAIPPARATPAPGVPPVDRPVASAQRAPAGASAERPAPPPAMAVPPQPVAASAPPPATARAVVSRAELAPELQRQLPALAVSGTVYSSDPAQRLLMVNGELLHEGDRIGPDLVVDEIRRKDAVLRFKGQRFSVSP